MAENITNFHVQYMDVTSQHWSPSSERYAGGDHLMTAIYNGWVISDCVEVEEHWFAGMRSITLYHFELARGDETMNMPVVSSPYVNRFIIQSRLCLVHRDATGSEAKNA